MQKVKFFCKPNKEGVIIIHSICRTTSSHKFCFAKSDQDLNMHLPSVRASVLAADVKTKRHVDHTLKGDEVYTYYDLKTSNFWFNGKQLERKEAKEVSNKPSEDHEELVPSPAKKRNVGQTNMDPPSTPRKSVERPST